MNFKDFKSKCKRWVYCRILSILDLTLFCFELQASKAAAQQELETARSAQYAKAGEISTLRRTMEKVGLLSSDLLNRSLTVVAYMPFMIKQAATHAEMMGKLRSEKVDSETRRAKLELDMTAEIDRLKTRMVFKVRSWRHRNRLYTHVPLH